MEVMFFAVLLGVGFFSIMVALSRWIFRINDIIDRLDSILHELRGNSGSIQENKVQEYNLNQTETFM